MNYPSFALMVLFFSFLSFFFLLVLFPSPCSSKPPPWTYFPFSFLEKREREEDRLDNLIISMILFSAKVPISAFGNGIKTGNKDLVIGTGLQRQEIPTRAQIESNQIKSNQIKSTPHLLLPPSIPAQNSQPSSRIVLIRGSHACSVCMRTLRHSNKYL